MKGRLSRLRYPARAFIWCFLPSAPCCGSPLLLASLRRPTSSALLLLLPPLASPPPLSFFAVAYLSVFDYRPPPLHVFFFFLFVASCLFVFILFYSPSTSPEKNLKK